MNGETRDLSPPAIRSAYGISGGVTMQLVVSTVVSRQPPGRCLARDVLLPPLYDQIDRRCSRAGAGGVRGTGANARSEEHTSELQSQSNLVCRLLLEKKKT